MTGGRSFVLDHRAGWRDEPTLCDAVILQETLRLAADTDAPRPLNDAAGTFGGLSDPTGSAAGADGRRYRVEAGTVRRYDPCEDALVPLPCQPHLSDPHGLAVTPAGDVVIVDTGNRRLLVLAPDGVALRRVIPAPRDHPGWTPVDVVVNHARLLVSDTTGGLVHVFTCAGRHVATWDAPPAPTALAVDVGCRVYVAQGSDPQVRVFSPTGELLELRETTEGLEDLFDPPAFPVESPPPTYPAEGTFISAALDSQRPRCVWHRALLDADVPAGTNIAIRTLTADVPLSAAEVAVLPVDRWHGGQVHGVVGDAPWDCLVLSPPGRYLWLRLTLTGGGRGTPRVCSARVEYPRVTSLRFLPAVYREEPVSADFTERFLALLDSVRGSVARHLDAMPALLDPAATPDGSCGEGDFLTWLASWLGLATDLRLPTAVFRRLLAQAHRLYRLAGTPAGIKAHLEICTGVRVHVLEDFSLRRWLFVGTGRLGDRSAVWDSEVVRRLQLDAGNSASAIGTAQLIGSTDPLRDPFHLYAHRFRVYLPGEGEELRRLAERIVELAKPAHTEARVLLVAPRMRVGTQAFVGVDTVIGAYPTQTRTGESRLGSDSVLSGSAAVPERPSPRVGRTTRVGTTVLD